MNHWNQKQCIAIYHTPEYTACVALDSNFNLDSNHPPVALADNEFQIYVDSLELRLNAKGERGLIILTYGLDNHAKCAILCQESNVNYQIIDILSVANFINDSDGMHCRKVTYPKTNLTYLSGKPAPKGKWKEAMQITYFYKEATERGLL